MRFQFDPEKALETILYVAQKIGGDMYSTLKIIYLADKLHLEQYGCLIFGSKYSALPFGATPSETYDIIKCARADEGANCHIKNIQNEFTLDGNNIRPARAAHQDVFSKSDIKCLNEAIEKYGHLSFGELKDLAHGKDYQATPQNGTIRLETIASTLPNAADLIQHLADPYPGSA